jgi:molecular chaperone GrpE
MHNNDPHAPHDAQGENPDVETSTNSEIETLKLQ